MSKVCVHEKASSFLKEQVSTIRALNLCGLFEGLTREDLASVLSCLGATTIKRSKGDYVFQPDAVITHVGVVLEGSVNLVQEDYWGNRSLIDRLSIGGILGEAYACKQREMFPLRVIAAENCTILLIDCKRILTTCSTACSYHIELLKNLVTTIAGRNIALIQKIEHTSQRSLEDKVMSYLSSQAALNHSSTFTILFSRQELADYLSIDRSSLSRTLSSLKDKGLIDYHGHCFELFSDDSRTRNS